MKRVIICEGCDNVGKSYLVKHLITSLTPHLMTYRHFGPPAQKGRLILKEQLNVLSREMKGIDDGSGVEIWDRSVIGEDVYGPMYRHGQYDHAEYHIELSHAVKKRERQIFLIVLYTDGEMFKRLKLKAKDDEVIAYQRQEDAANISIAFVDVATNLRLKNTLFVNCANYETLNERNDYIMRRVRAWLKLTRYHYEMAEDYAQTFFNAKSMLWRQGKGFVNKKYTCSNYANGQCALGKDHQKYCEFGEVYDQPTAACGAIQNVDYIFVGEAPGHKGCGKLGIPFFGDRSGNLLQEALDSCGMLPTRYYMTNVVKCCPKENELSRYGSREKLICVKQLAKEIASIENKNPDAVIIALGKVASKELSNCGLHHKMMYHPAYYLRKGIEDDFIVDFKKVVTACH